MSLEEGGSIVRFCQRNLPHNISQFSDGCWAMHPILLIVEYIMVNKRIGEILIHFRSVWAENMLVGWD